MSQLETELREQYPELFPEEYVEISIGRGWWPMVKGLMHNIQEDVKATGIKCTVAQIKEKFRGLRFYVDGGSDEVRRMVALAEEASYHTCEGCGKVTENRNTFERTKSSGWIVTLCDDCWSGGK